MLDSAGVEVKVGRHPVHESDEAPEGVHLVLHHVQDGGQEVGHSLESKLKKTFFL
jgi:hypothetical protein